MKLERDQLSDVVMTWPAGSRRIAEIIRTGRCPSYRTPHQAKNRSRVALVDPSGNVMALFRLAGIDRNQKILGADGKVYDKGCILRAVKGTARRPAGNDHRWLKPPRWVGAFRYFDDQSGNSVWYGDAGPGGDEAFDDGPSSPNRLTLTPYWSDNTGKSISRQEALLVEQYAKWLGGRPDRFLAGRIPNADVRIDLFIRGVRLLVEAKARVDRNELRMAVGQLYDYRRYFIRLPRLAVLLPERPNPDLLELLVSRKIGCIWQTPKGRFGDNLDGDLTSALRRAPVD